MELLVINYHYIDDENKYKAGIYPTSPKRLSSQIALIKKRYTFISGDELVAAVRGLQVLPKKAAILTFDDSLRSQYEYALPVLEEKKVPAIFFFLTGHITDHKAYTLHKIHYLLSQIDEEELLARVLIEYAKLTNASIAWEEIGVDTMINWYRYDNETTAKFKYLLNHALSDNLVEIVVNTLFCDLLNITEQEFSEQFFLSREDMQTLARHPLASIGVHTHTHMNIVKCSARDVRDDILANTAVISDVIGTPPLEVISYPFGMITEDVFDEKVRQVAEENGLVCGFSIEKKINADFNNPFLLGRFTSNDIPGGKNPLMDF